MSRHVRNVGARGTLCAPRSACARRWRVLLAAGGVLGGLAGCGDDGPSPDTTPPVLVATVPADGATAVNPRLPVRFRFDEDLDAASVGSHSLVVNAAGGPVTGAVSYVGTTREVAFTPALHLVGNAVHVATLRAGLRDLAGNATADSTVIAFTTGDDPEDADGDGYAPDDGDCADGDPDVNPGALDRPDDDRRDLNCDGFEGDIARSVFVAPDGADGAPGTPAAPLRTIGAALQLAAGSSKDAVIVARGTYAESLILPRGVSLYGGFDAANDWVRDPLDRATWSVITAVQIVVRAESIDRPAWMESLRLSATTPVVAGESAVALLARAADSLTVRHVELAAAAGADGAGGAAGRAGHDGPAGADGAPGCEGEGTDCEGCSEPEYGLGGQGACTDGGRGGAPGYGPIESEAGGGVFGGGSGGVAGLNGLPGGPGGDGSSGGPGTGGAGGDALGRIDGDGFWRGDPGDDGLAGETGSSGGGGGGGSGGFPPPCTLYGGAGGGGAAGGCGGEGGRGGQGGGGSIGLLLVDSSLFIEDATFQAAGGGTGGAGGPGGPPGLGGAGGIGGAAIGTAGAGGDGGRGGDGGAGGGGGGGGGGVAFGIYRAGTSAPIVIASTFEVGAGGAGGSGAPGAGDGTPGASGDISAARRIRITGR